MKELKNLRDLLCHEVQVMYSCEKLSVPALKRMTEKADNRELKSTFQQHLEETKIQMERLEEAAKLLDIDPEGDGNPSIKGLIAEGEKVMHKDTNPETLDATLIAGAQKIEHYEISGYGTAVHYAKELGLNDVADLLIKNLEEEKNSDFKLNVLAQTKINQKIKNVVN
jgi:ferritin-like metal-binding protein YciE